MKLKEDRRKSNYPYTIVKELNVIELGEIGRENTFTEILNDAVKRIYYIHQSYFNNNK